MLQAVATFRWWKLVGRRAGEVRIYRWVGRGSRGADGQIFEKFLSLKPKGMLTPFKMLFIHPDDTCPYYTKWKKKCSQPESWRYVVLTVACNIIQLSSILDGHCYRGRTMNGSSFWHFEQRLIVNTMIKVGIVAGQGCQFVFTLNSKTFQERYPKIKNIKKYGFSYEYIV